MDEDKEEEEIVLSGGEGEKSDDEEEDLQNNSEKVTAAANKKTEEEKEKMRQEKLKKANQAFKSSIQYDLWENEKEMKPKDLSLRHKWWGKGNKSRLVGILHSFKRYSGAGPRGNDSDKAMLDSLQKYVRPQWKEWKNRQSDDF